ncbi:MAG: ABC transporter ATP-binding protein [Gammaproteobacteria bacterium]|nr:ABC transporter ATP-binding protein [Gammaproteobacteria bacterium]MXY89909.1 ABC transporter ATP-binding protein [Gammaproteobacteria bacterium]MYG97765.1 ABC transporter ATP-binding protein [Gammaproteobacteria bacterium]
MSDSEQRFELTVENLCVRAGGKLLVENASFSLRSGEFTALLGPNGAGKTSLLRGILGLADNASGNVRLQGQALAELDPMQRARKLSYLPQRCPLAWPSPVRDVVSLGRYAWGCAPGRLDDRDARAVRSALASCDLLELAGRRADTLSGGELARMHCARAFATEAPLLFADEPVASLDPRHKFRIMELIRDHVLSGAGALVVLHDVSLAARFADRLIWMKDGRVVADGTRAATLDASRLGEIYGVRGRVEGDRVDLEGPL